MTAPPGTDEGILEVIEEIGAVAGVRAVVLGLGDEAFAAGAHSGLDPTRAREVTRTVRRMLTASATMGLPLEELLVNFGPARMLVVPLHDDASLAIFIERDTAVAAVRSVVRVLLPDLVRRLGAPASGSAPAPAARTPDQEVEALLRGPLAEPLRRIEEVFVVAAAQAAPGRGAADPNIVVRDQLREWLLCCSPSTYTLPLLIDGLAQQLADSADLRRDFMAQAREVVRSSG